MMPRSAENVLEPIALPNAIQEKDSSFRDASATPPITGSKLRYTGNANTCKHSSTDSSDVCSAQHNYCKRYDYALSLLLQLHAELICQPLLVDPSLAAHCSSISAAPCIHASDSAVKLLLQATAFSINYCLSQHTCLAKNESTEPCSEHWLCCLDNVCEAHCSCAKRQHCCDVRKHVQRSQDAASCTSSDHIAVRSTAWQTGDELLHV
eukprot:5331-Heterococcus_DN1.PRE.2